MIKDGGQDLLLAGQNSNSVPLYSERAFFQSSLSISPAEILSKHSIGNFVLEIGELDDVMYEESIKHVTCINEICNKKLVWCEYSLEWSKKF